MYNITKRLKDLDQYCEFVNALRESILLDNELNKDDICTVKINDDKIEMTYAELLINTVLWTPYAYYPDIKLTKEDIFDCKTLNADTLFNYFDSLIDKFITHDNCKELNIIISQMIETLGTISYYFNPKLGNTINLFSLIKLDRNNKEFDEIISTKFDRNDTSYDIEQELKIKLKRLLHILETDDNCLKDYVNAKEGINSLQLSQFAINVGNKPSLSGQTIPMPVNSNFLKGLETPSQYYIDAISGRKAQIINSTSLKQSGYLNRKLSILTIGVNSEFDIDDCHTPNYLEVKIEDETFLKRFHGRTMITDCKKNGTHQQLKTIDSKKDLDLIGKVIKVRSPITCCLKDGICRKCYGEKLSFVNQDIHIGLLATMEITSRVSQMLISAKHLLNTSSEQIIWDEKFTTYFHIENDSVRLNPECEESFHIRIVQEDDDGDKYDIVSISKLYIEDENGESIEIEFDKEVFLSAYLKRMLEGRNKDGSFIIGSDELDRKETLFYVEIANEELASHLKNVFSIIESKEKMGITDYNQLIMKFNQFLIKGKINIQSVHPEIVCYSLIRDIEDQSRRPDFKKFKPDYTILRVSDAILKSGSLIERLSFEKLRRQFNSTSVFSDIYKTSLFDALFMN